MKAKPLNDSNGQHAGYLIFCPACKCGHLFRTVAAFQGGPVWTFNGDTERPTFTPSMLVWEPGYLGLPREAWISLHSVDARADGGNRIPVAILDDATAQENHCGQTLAQLNERGGCSWVELAAMIERRSEFTQGREAAKALVLARTRAWMDAQPRKSVCHSFVTNGQIQFLGDCAHDMKGQTVPLPDVD